MLPHRARLLLCVCACAAAAAAASPVRASPAQRGFGHAIKNGLLPAFPAELEVFAHACAAAPCVVTQLVLPSVYPHGTDAMDWEGARLRLYVDGEAAASVDVLLRELACVGRLGAVGRAAPRDGSPFGHTLFGKGARTGGVWSTVRVPFAASLRVTLTNAASAAKFGRFWLIIRGVEALPVTLGGELTLPDQARLVLARTSAAALAPLQLLTLATAPSDSAGALLIAFVDAFSAGDFNFLEGCFRWWPAAGGGGGNATRGPPQFLSSGTEDLFLSASYFDEGMYNGPQAGLTFLGNGSAGAGGGSAAAMYKTFDRDLVLWSGGMQLAWRNFEAAAGAGCPCPSAWPWTPQECEATHPHPHPSSGVGSITVDALVWSYAWPANASLLTFSGAPAA